MVKTLYLFQRAWSRMSAKKVLLSKIYKMLYWYKFNIYIYIWKDSKVWKLNCKNVKNKTLYQHYYMYLYHGTFYKYNIHVG